MKDNFILSVTAYVEDTDCYGIVNHAKFINFLERARTEYLQHIGFSLETYRQQGIYFVIKHIDIDYQRPILLGDKIDVHAQLLKAKRASMIFSQAITRRDELLCQARVIIVCINDKVKPIAIPPALREIL